MLLTRIFIIIGIISLMLPLLLWFFRNWMRIIHKKDFLFINRILWPSVLIGIIIFVTLLLIAIFAFK
ncbi:MAG: hypothetical protein GY679_00680 [Mycoplasma sp.]|nr:hypothetical protein [Mycoplasma sp.]